MLVCPRIKPRIDSTFDIGTGIHIKPFVTEFHADRQTEIIVESSARHTVFPILWFV